MSMAVGGLLLLWVVERLMDFSQKDILSSDDLKALFAPEFNSCQRQGAIIPIVLPLEIKTALLPKKSRDKCN